MCVCGDGGMQMAGMEVLVALKEGLRIVFAVFNDGRYWSITVLEARRIGHAAAGSRVVLYAQGAGFARGAALVEL